MLSEKELIDHSYNYVILFKQESFDILKDIINQEKEKIIKEKSQLNNCSDREYYCKLLDYNNIINKIYNKFYNKNTKVSLFKFIRNNIYKNIVVNFQYLVVKYFINIKSNNPDIDMDLLLRWAKAELLKKGWNTGEVLIMEILNETILLVIDKLKIDDWQYKYKQIYVYLIYYLYYAKNRVNRNKYVVDIPIKVIQENFNYTLDLNSENNLDEKEKKKPINKFTYNNISLDKWDSIIDLDINHINKNVAIQQIFNEIKSKFGEKKLDIIQMYYVGGYTLKEIGQKYNYSAEYIRQIIKKIIVFLNNLSIYEEDDII